MIILELTKKFRCKLNRQRLIADMRRGTIREERGNPVTEVTFKPQGRSPGLNSLTPSTSPHVYTMNTHPLTYKKGDKKLRRLAC